MTTHFDSLLALYQAKADELRAMHDAEPHPHGPQGYMLEGMRLGLVYAMTILEAYLKEVKQEA